jgi:DNA-binding CsgD family transcriptional regulator/PAS domain-containing protein
MSHSVAEHLTTGLAETLATILARRASNEEWLVSCPGAIQSLLGGDFSAIVVQSVGETLIEGTASSHVSEELHASDFRADGLPPAGVWARRRRHRRHHLPGFGSFGVTTRLPLGGAVTALVLVDHPLPESDAERARELLEAVQPALASAAEDRFGDGMHSHRQMPPSLARLLGTLGDGVLVCDRAGTVLWRNASLSRMLGAEPEWRSVYEHAKHVAREAVELAHMPPVGSDGEEQLELPPVVAGVRTKLLSYRLRAVYVAEYQSTLVTFATVGKIEPTADETLHALRGQYGLTERETEVTGLLLHGKSNVEIAAQLHISGHTARHHTERILDKMGVRSRAAIAVAMASLRF